MKIKWKIQLSNIIIILISFLILFILLLLFLNNFFSYIVSNYKESLLNQREENIKNIVEMIYTFVENNYKAEDKNNYDELALKVRDAILKMRYDGNNYVWIHTLDESYFIVHPSDKLDKKFIPDLKDVNGKFIIRELNKEAEKNGEGYVDYMWNKLGETEPQQKLSYVKLFKPYKWVIGTGVYVDDINKKIKVLSDRMNWVRTRIFILASVILLIMIFFVIIYFVFFSARFITKPIKIIKTNFDEISSGNLNRKIKILSNDEIGGLSKNFNNFVDKLSNMIIRIKGAMDNALNISKKLAMSSQASSVSINNIKDNIENMMSKTEELDNDIIKTGTLSDEVSDFVMKVSDQTINQSSNISQSSASIEEIISSISNIANTVQNKIKLVEDLEKKALLGKNEMEETIIIIKKITESTKIIMDMLTVINNIAAQTNLLSMNAAIEAAHAGDAGKGFNVVADEIRKLSEDTSRNSKEISKSLKGIVEFIHISEEASIKTGEYFNDIISGVADVSNAMIEINNSMEELSFGSEQIMTSLSLLIETSGVLNESSEIMKQKVIDINVFLKNISSLSNSNKEGMKEIMSSIEKIYDSILTLSNTGSDYSEDVKNIINIINEFRT